MKQLLIIILVSLLAIGVVMAMLPIEEENVGVSPKKAVEEETTDPEQPSSEQEHTMDNPGGSTGSDDTGHTGNDPAPTDSDPSQPSGSEQNSSQGSPGLRYISNGNGTCSVTGIGDCTDTGLVIPLLSPDGDRVTAIGSTAFKNNSRIHSVNLPAGITTVFGGAFQNCTALESVTFRSDDSYLSIVNYAFSGCTSLKTVTFEGNIAVSIMNYAFNGCSSLEAVDLSESTRVASLGENCFRNTNDHFKVYVSADILSDYETPWAEYAAHLAVGEFTLTIFGTGEENGGQDYIYLKINTQPTDPETDYDYCMDYAGNRRVGDLIAKNGSVTHMGSHIMVQNASVVYLYCSGYGSYSTYALNGETYDFVHDEPIVLVLTQDSTLSIFCSYD